MNILLEDLKPFIICTVTKFYVPMIKIRHNQSQIKSFILYSSFLGGATQSPFIPATPKWLNLNGNTVYQFRLTRWSQKSVLQIVWRMFGSISWIFLASREFFRHQEASLGLEINKLWIIWGIIWGNLKLLILIITVAICIIHPCSSSYTKSSHD